ncbi:leucine-rich repeat-containing protein 4B-like isoform X2 [Pecten maximus]|uniref:leucine-rich repeat-containing protein 4B-like isoform X2 n=1 Tax=Pecten maximus TaxID=6579 RepID=UPI001458FE75|nr:leucine-rich repeat-containing protein 4B-like isoform X2 [Pecten maximus]
MEMKNIQTNQGFLQYTVFSVVLVFLCLNDALGVPCNPKCTTCDTDFAGHVIKVVCTGVDIPTIPDSVQEMYLSEGTVSLPGIFKDYVFIGKTDLRVIHLKKYNITMVWESPFINLTNLVEVDLSFNNIPNFDKTNLAGPVALRVLNLNHNNIQQIPNDAFSNQTSLTELHMSMNKVTLIPSNAFRGLRSLEHIDLSYNKLTTISGTVFQNCPALTTVILRGNRLDTVAPYLFQGLHHLHTLNLQRNFLVSIGQDALVGTNLTFLDLSRNRLHDVRSTMAVLKNISGENVEVFLTANRLNMNYGPGIFSGVTLKLLDLQYNGISMFPQDAFTTNHIGNLKLGHNNLTSLPSNMEAYLTSVKPNVTLDHNPWQCDCGLLWFSRFLHQLSPPDLGTRLQSNLPCTGPALLKNKLIQDIATIIEPGCKANMSTPTTSQHAAHVATVTSTKATPAASRPVLLPTSTDLIQPGVNGAPNSSVMGTTRKLSTLLTVGISATQSTSVTRGTTPAVVAPAVGGNKPTMVAPAVGGSKPTAVVPTISGGMTAPVAGGITPVGVAPSPGGNKPPGMPPAIGGSSPAGVTLTAGGIKSTATTPASGGNSPTGVAKVTNSTVSALLSQVTDGTTTSGQILNTGQSQGQTKTTSEGSNDSFPIGAVVGPLAALCLIGGAVGWFLYRKKSQGNQGRINSQDLHEPEETDYLWDRPFPVPRSLGPSKTHFNINSLKNFDSYQSY